MKRANLFQILSFTLLIIASLLCAGTITVKKDGSGDFTTISDAVMSAAAGDNVYVYPGTYNEQVYLTDGINLLGHSPHSTIIDAQQMYDYVIHYDGYEMGSVISGFRITGSATAGSGGGGWDYGGIHVEGGSVIIRNNIIEGNYAGISVLSGANPQIINNTINGNFNGIIFEGAAAIPAPEYMVLIIYASDKNSAAEYQGILSDSGIAANVIQMGDITTTNLASYRLIMVTDDTGGGYNWGTQAQVDAINNSNRPVLGIGNGGAALFQELGISINYGNSAFANTNRMHVVETGNPVFHEPYDIEILKDGDIIVYDRIYTSNVLAVYEGSMDSEVVKLCSLSPTSPQHYPLTGEEGHYLWGFRDTPDHLTETGRKLLVNLVRSRTTICDYYLPAPILTPLYSEPATNPEYNRYYFRVENWYQYGDELFEVSPDLPPCGSNPDGSRTWVEFYDMQQQYVYGYCALSQAADLLLLHVTLPADAPEDVMMRIWDRRCDSEAWSNLVFPRDDPYYSHTIMNNIITNNSHAGIFYYNFLNEGQILYNDVWANTYNYFNNDGGQQFSPQPATGEISEDPLFEDTLNYRLTDESPCTDTGNPDTIYNDPDGSRNDMGVWGGPESTGIGTHPGSGFIFTEVGNLPTAFIEQAQANEDHGLTNVSYQDHIDFAIPQYHDSPFGGSLRINGVFGDVDVADGLMYYKILYAMWPDEDTPPEPEDYQPVTTGLYKILTIPQWDGSVIYQRTHLGPKVVYGVENLYEYTHTGAWSSLDLRCIWHTSSLPNGKYTLTYKAYKPSEMYLMTLEEMTLFPNDMDHLTLLVNNTGVYTEINDVRYDPSSPYWDEITDGILQECGIITLQDNQENLRLNISATHPDGYLRHWVLDAYYGKNNYAGVIASDTYPGTSPPDNWHGVLNQIYNTSDSPAFTDWVRCAYQFRLRAYTRATNGQGYLYGTPPIYYSNSFSDHYFVEFDCSWCGGADINKSGRVDLTDLMLVASQWLQECSGENCGE
ncbi:nitrous oxide reductase family maturation protein NosD [Limihaloglobus sulfuriphilus]|uniref:Probable pectate lyase C n=1 Tax=Limihaloglobus sulfuriphilus TaxID=1851148 RepID=A0A1Q2MHS2_9BACT|nr:right-handed parallel beta-helix repeat-containing protein [Limihaloglobus sulfuriphilus]AQQ72204.1 nitrous oxide reductase family maturation protein NosD [Limihaloglobus sulfuriphilus]